MYIICPLYAQVFNVVIFCPMSGRHSFTESEAARGSFFQCEGKECVETCRQRLIDKLDYIQNLYYIRDENRKIGVAEPRD